MYNILTMYLETVPTINMVKCLHYVGTNPTVRSFSNVRYLLTDHLVEQLSVFKSPSVCNGTVDVHTTQSITKHDVNIKKL